MKRNLLIALAVGLGLTITPSLGLTLNVGDFQAHKDVIPASKIVKSLVSTEPVSTADVEAIFADVISEIKMHQGVTTRGLEGELGEFLDIITNAIAGVAEDWQREFYERSIQVAEDSGLIREVRITIEKYIAPLDSGLEDIPGLVLYLVRDTETNQLMQVGFGEEIFTELNSHVLPPMMHSSARRMTLTLYHSSREVLGHETTLLLLGERVEAEILPEDPQLATTVGSILKLATFRAGSQGDKAEEIFEGYRLVTPPPFQGGTVEIPLVAKFTTTVPSIGLFEAGLQSFIGELLELFTPLTDVERQLLEEIWGLTPPF